MSDTKDVLGAILKFTQGYEKGKEKAAIQQKLQKALESGEGKYKIKQVINPITGEWQVQLEDKTPLDNLLAIAEAAKAQTSIYEAGGPAPSMFGQGQQTVEQPQQEPPLNIPTGEGNVNLGGPGADYVPKELDIFHRATGYKPNPVAEKLKETEGEKKIQQKSAEQQALQSADLVASAVRRLSDTYAKAVKEGGMGGKGREITSGASLFAGGELGSKYPNTAAYSGQKTEVLTKMMPLLTQQGDKPGSVRLVTTVFDRLSKTLPAGNTPPINAKAMLTTTLQNMYGFAKAIKNIRARDVHLDNLDEAQLQMEVNAIKYTPEEQAKLDEIIAYATEPIDQLIVNDIEYKKFKQLINK